MCIRQQKVYVYRAKTVLPTILDQTNKVPMLYGYGAIGLVIMGSYWTQQSSTNVPKLTKLAT